MTMTSISAYTSAKRVDLFWPGSQDVIYVMHTVNKDICFVFFIFYNKNDMI